MEAGCGQCSTTNKPQCGTKVEGQPAEAATPKPVEATVPVEATPVSALMAAAEEAWVAHPTPAAPAATPRSARASRARTPNPTEAPPTPAVVDSEPAPAEEPTPRRAARSSHAASPAAAPAAAPPATAPPTADATAERALLEKSIRSMTVIALKVQLLERELPIDGLKPALAARLLAHHGLGDVQLKVQLLETTPADAPTPRRAMRLRA